MKLVFFIVAFLMICGCQERKANEASKKNPPYLETEILKKLSVKKVGELRFRMAYVIEGKTLNFNQLKKIGQDKPVDYYDTNTDTILLKKFQELGLVKNKYELLLKKFKSLKIIDFEHPETSFELSDSIQKKINCQLRKSNKEMKYNLLVSDSLLSSQIEVEGFYLSEGLKFMLLDVIPGGYKEIVILNNYYISNGDNSDIYVYEIKKNY